MPVYFSPIDAFNIDLDIYLAPRDFIKVSKVDELKIVRTVTRNLKT